jgi:hypothetical protein
MSSLLVLYKTVRYTDMIAKQNIQEPQQSGTLEYSLPSPPEYIFASASHEQYITDESSSNSLHGWNNFYRAAKWLAESIHDDLQLNNNDLAIEGVLTEAQR